MRDRPECAIALLSHGCEVNVEDEEGNTPLHLAVKQKNLSLIQALTVFGADLEYRLVWYAVAHPFGNSTQVVHGG